MTFLSFRGTFFIKITFYWYTLSIKIDSISWTTSCFYTHFPLRSKTAITTIMTWCTYLIIIIKMFIWTYTISSNSWYITFNTFISIWTTFTFFFTFFTIRLLIINFKITFFTPTKLFLNNFSHRIYTTTSTIIFSGTITMVTSLMTTYSFLSTIYYYSPLFEICFYFWY